MIYAQLYSLWTEALLKKESSQMEYVSCGFLNRREDGGRWTWGQLRK